MAARHGDPPNSVSGPSDGWAIASLALLGLALASHYLLPPKRGRSQRLPQFRSAEEDARTSVEGRPVPSATAPSDIRRHGWKDVLLRVYGDLSKHRIMALAAGITYYSILAIFPAIAALVAIYGLFSDPSTIARHLDQLNGFLPAGAIDVARDQLTRVASKGSQTLGLTFLIGLGVSLWSANAAMKALFDTLNIVYGEDEKRGFVKLNAISMSFTVGGVLFVLAALGSIVVLPVILDYTGLTKVGDLLLRIGRWPAMYVVIAFALAVIYRFGSSREGSRWRLVTWGSAIAAFFWLGISGLFSWYAANIGQFNETYGSLGAVIGFMTWLWLSAIVILLGCEIDAALEDQAARETITGARFHPQATSIE